MALKTAAAALGAVAAWKFVDGKYGLSKDLSVMLNAYPVVKKVRAIQAKKGANFIMSWYMTLEQPGVLESTAFIQAETGRRMSFLEVERLSNRVAHWALSKGLKVGDVVALVMDNRPEFVCFWLGLAKVGVIAAFINTNLRGKPLVHAVSSGGAVAVLCGTEHAGAVEASVEELRGANVRLFASWGAGGAAGEERPGFCDSSLDEDLPQMSEQALDERHRDGVKCQGACYYIYTSGTTGLPKACNMSHYRVMMLGAVPSMSGIKQGDVIYGSGLPMYHSGANIGVGTALTIGVTYVIRTRFSASKHFEDCANYGCTGMQYIGELCRYLLAAPAGQHERSHKLRVAFGNGLRPEIWNEFQRRFSIPEILEIYGSTEGAGGLVNYCKNYEGQGAVGWQGALMRKAQPSPIVRFNVETEEPVRDSKGFCIECAPGEAGELIAPIRVVASTPDGEQSSFEGYTNKEASAKKILRDVFEKGDQWFRTGDLLKKDEKGYFYFVDRIGDTFRWKGENVSTMEVSEVLSGYTGVVDANVYGVQVPGKDGPQDGRACMVALTTENNETPDPVKFATYCRANLPSYSVPLFVRLLAEDINVTGTFKHQKVEYRNQGCDPRLVKSDELWWFNNASGAYEPYGLEQFNMIAAGQSKL